MLSNGTCLHRDCFFPNSTDVTKVGLNPANELEKLGFGINCTIGQMEWKNYLSENSKMPSDEYFQYVCSTFEFHSAAV